MDGRMDGWMDGRPHSSVACRMAEWKRHIESQRRRERETEENKRPYSYPWQLASEGGGGCSSVPHLCTLRPAMYDVSTYVRRRCRTHTEYVYWRREKKKKRREEKKKKKKVEPHKRTVARHQTPNTKHRTQTERTNERANERMASDCCDVPSTYLCTCHACASQPSAPSVRDWADGQEKKKEKEKKR